MTTAGARIRLLFFTLGGGAAIVLGAAFAGPGCTILTNDALPDDASKPEAGEAGDGATNGPACGACVAQECTGQWAVCLTSGACHAMHVCSNPFTESSAARQACFCSITNVAEAGSGEAGAPSVDPRDAYVAFAACNDARTCTKCMGDCPSCAAGAPDTTPPACDGTDGGVDGGRDAGGDAGDAGVAGPRDGGEAGADASMPAHPAVDACAACVAASCSAEKGSCAAGSACATFLACAHACGDSACLEQCGASNASGKAAAESLASCTATRCSADCGL